MLEKVKSSTPEHLLVFREIRANEMGSGLCFVRDGKHKVSRTSKPFITLYLQDVNNSILPGYIFDMENFLASGLELTQVMGSVIKVNYAENFIPNFGMSLRLTKVQMVKNPSPDLVARFMGTVPNVDSMFQELQDNLGAKIGTKYSIPFNICTATHLDYSQGRAGGLLKHYCDMYDVLCVYEDILGLENRRQLFGTFLLYIHAHNNYIQAEKRGAVDIVLATKLLASIKKVMDNLKLADGATEVCNIFFGYEPKDLFVRTICQVSESVMRVSKEKTTWDTLPITREGDAGYGTIRRYASAKGD